ncbi:MAG: hypothetical protein GY810_01200 [Aureispira sp.]|nr:hypothetical protein [Aureispira sp.]
MDKIIFLDIDGVLNSETDFIDSVYKYNPVHSKLQKGERWKVINVGMLAILNDVVKQTGAKIVLSTTWRTKCDAKKLTKIFQRYGDIWEHGVDTIIGRTTDMKASRRYDPYSYSVPNIISENEIRESEINLWMSENPVPESFIIIDDILMNFGSNMIHTDEFIGLTVEIGNKIISKLGRLPKYQRKFDKEYRHLWKGIV